MISVGGERDRICFECDYKWDSEADKPKSEPLQDTLAWFQQAVPNPTLKQLTIQLGVDAEECAELLEAITPVDGSLNGFDASLRLATDWLAFLSSDLKAAPGQYNPAALDQEPILDALVDKIVTAVGVAHMLGHDILGALAEVNRANFSKFEDGKPIFDANGKITKGINYIKPDLTPFIHTRNFNV